jgi:hypothetical protein
MVGGKGVLTVTDYRDLIALMRYIDPELVKALRKRYRKIGADLVTDIKKEIPNSAPLSGMVTKVGRLSWSRTMNQSRPVKSIVVRDRKRIVRSKLPTVGLVQVVARSAPLVMADMAGRSGAYINSRDETREYDYTYTGKYGGKYVAKRKHKIRGQGRAMIQKLGGRASRYVYPGAENKLPEVRKNIQLAVNEAANNVNQRLRRR